MAGSTGSALEVPIGGPAGNVTERAAKAAADTGAGPIWAALAVAGVGYVVVVLALIVTGLVLVRVDLLAGLRHWDEDVSRWFVPRRTSTGAHVTAFWTELANTQGIVVVAVVAEVVLAARRRWRDLLLIVVGLAVELAVFLTVNEVVRRPRPSVTKLGIEPATFSFPSGHIAATVVLYGSIALLLMLSYRDRRWVRAVWLVPIVFGLIVGYARVYRGMHHLTDVVAGAILGIAALGVAVAATRASAVSAARRASGHERGLDEPGVDAAATPEPHDAVAHTGASA